MRAASPDEILVAFAEPAQQNRLTVLVRIILAIPHLVVLWALGIAAEVVVIICWFAALFLGRLPEGLAGFLTGVPALARPGAGVPVPAHRPVPAVRAG